MYCSCSCGRAMPKQSLQFYMRGQANLGREQNYIGSGDTDQQLVISDYLAKSQ